MPTASGDWATTKADYNFGNPGVKTIWRGLRRLHDIAATYGIYTTKTKSL